MSTEMNHPCVILPEEQAPEDMQDCERANCANSGIASSGEGNPQGTLMLILDNPGARRTEKEIRSCAGPGKPFNSA